MLFILKVIRTFFVLKYEEISDCIGPKTFILLFLVYPLLILLGYLTYNYPSIINIIWWFEHIDTINWTDPCIFSLKEILICAPLFGLLPLIGIAINTGLLTIPVLILYLLYYIYKWIKSNIIKAIAIEKEQRKV